ncbi:hypothetical protein AAHE18_05G123200 [Arachis hypogaea]
MMAQFNAFQAQASRSNTNLLQDLSSHFYLHPSETPGISLTDAPLTTSNYHSWSRSATLSLNAKNKLRFIDGTLVKPERDDPSFGAWDRCNTFVLSWLHRSLSPEILQSVLWCNNAYELWMDLKHRFDQGDLFRIANLEEELFSLRQGELTITSYYTKLKSIWEELDEFRPIALCSCLHNCECGKNLEMIREHREQSHLIRFLRGLNDQYANVRSQLMLVTPLPTVAAAFSSLLHQERQLMHSIDHEARMMANTVNTNAFGTYQNNGSSSIRGRGRGRGGRGKGHGRGTPKLCSHCGKTGHLVDTCYYKHGFPPHMQRNQFKGNTDGPSAMNSVNSINAASNEEGSIEPLIQKDERVSLDGLFSDKQKEALFALFQQQYDATLWHHRLGHISCNKIQQMKVAYPFITYHNSDKRLPFNESHTKSENVFDLVHMDIWGPIAIPSISGHKYFLTVVEDKSKFTWLFFLKNKSEVRKLIENFVQLVETQHNRVIKCIRSDNGQEFLMPSFYQTKGIIHQTSCVETPQQNGVVERRHQEILNVARTLIFNSNLPLCFWHYAVAHAVHILNRTPHIKIAPCSPYQVLYHTLPDIKRLKVFGCLVYASTLVSHRRKVDTRARKCVFLGFKSGTKGYVLLDTKTHEIIISRNVKFYEQFFPFKNTTGPFL